MENRSPEAGINAALPRRAASLLLLLTGAEDDEMAAAGVERSSDRAVTYDRDYLANPGQSFLPLERRHAETVLSSQVSSTAVPC